MMSFVIAERGDVGLLWIPGKGIASGVLVQSVKISTLSEAIAKASLEVYMEPGITGDTDGFDDATRMAIAVLSGNVETALALADEVQMRHLEPKGFVSRLELVQRLDAVVVFLRSIAGSLETETAKHAVGKVIGLVECGQPVR